MADQYIQYTVKQPERWDTVAFNCYGDISLQSKIINANPDVPITMLIPEGTILQIPIIDEAIPQSDNSKMPPWKQ